MFPSRAKVVFVEVEVENPENILLPPVWKSVICLPEELEYIAVLVAVDKLHKRFWPNMH